MAIKTYLTPEEIRGMYSNAGNVREKVMILFFADTGVRVSELLNVKKEDLDLENGTVLIPHLKRGIKKKCPSCGKYAGRRAAFCSRCGTDLSMVEAEGIEDRGRLVSLGDELVELLASYTEDMAPEDRIMPITRQWVHSSVRALAETIGLEGKCILNPETRQKHYVHPHNFRDSLAVSWLEVAASDASLQKALQEHLGHKNYDTTMRYNKLSATAIRKAADQVRKLRFGTGDGGS